MKTLEKIHCLLFGHIWVCDKLPSSDGSQEFRCDLCGKTKVHNVEAGRFIAVNPAGQLFHFNYRSQAIRSVICFNDGQLYIVLDIMKGEVCFVKRGEN